MRFCRYILRTTDPDGAQVFYSRLLGWQVQRQSVGGLFFVNPSDGGNPQPVAELGVLPERARALGAPPHWLGVIAVPDLSTYTQRLIQLGAEQRGPVQGQSQAGRDLVVLRDPQGAPLGLCSSGADPLEPSSAVAWHQLVVPDPDQAWSQYASLFGWQSVSIGDGGPDFGALRIFAQQPGDAPSGGIISNARTPQVHTQWLYGLRVFDVDKALDRVRALGGRVAAEPRALPGSTRFAVCEDAQGAAFALREDPSASPRVVEG